MLWISFNIFLKHLIECFFIKLRVNWTYIWESLPYRCQPIFKVINPALDRRRIFSLTKIITYVITKVKNSLLSINWMNLKWRVPYYLPQVRNIKIWLIRLINLVYSPHDSKSLSRNRSSWQVKSTGDLCDNRPYESHIIRN